MNNQEASKVAGVIAAVGTENLGKSLCALLEGDVRFDMSCAYVFRFDRTAVLLHDGYNGMVPAKTLSAYARGGYLLDPFYVACMHEHPAGLWRMSDLAPDSFLSSGFAISTDIHPCISSTHGSLVEELGYIIPLQAHTAVVFSLMKEQSHGPFTELEVRRLQTVAPIITQAFEAHWRLHPEEPGVTPGNPESHLESAFVDILQGQLTDSQRYIAKLLLQGHSNASIAHLLGISEGTVKVHKHNIYQRLQISSNADLFRLFINYISRASR
ncbi:helix-turn-helix domain-containing protein [Pseudomonas benzenivorans]|uniref:Helix-turn-helix transcriptional regulator n=1 Tax=Pseudomonas benzenivorans TaxID=556533 RepID=A0ABY5H7Z2_9PSED|nr:helix-turn-helix transcriptional regulator [Pseudomonas benzenivorans]UTW08199.1 helix-turn-helix transcriptional regulator [Pseudomonas benzenivorans]